MKHTMCITFSALMLASVLTVHSDENPAQDNAAAFTYSAAWKAAPAKRFVVFDRMDADGDGLLTAKECETYAEKSKKDVAEIKKQFVTWDKNADAKVTSIEMLGFAEEYTENGRFISYAEFTDEQKQKVEEGIPGNRTPHPRKRMLRKDYNKDLMISREEYLSKPSSDRELETFKKTFVKRDTNGDGVISEEEYVVFDSHGYFKRRMRALAEADAQKPKEK